MITIHNLIKEKIINSWDVRVDRKNRALGNPFFMLNENERHKVCRQYHGWLNQHIQDKTSFVCDELNRINDLYRKHGKLRLFCWCVPKECHAESIKKVIIDKKPKINKRKKIKKIRKSKFASRLEKAGEVKTIDENYVFSFGQLKDMKIREAIIADFKYVDWCVQEKIFKLSTDLQIFFDNIIETQTFDEEEGKAEAEEWAKMFD